MSDKETIRKGFFDDTLLEPCQVEVLASSGEVGCIVVHDKQRDDMEIEVREGSETYEVSKFLKKYHFKHRLSHKLLPEEFVVFYTKNLFFSNEGRPDPEELARSMLLQLVARIWHAQLDRK